MLDLQFVTEHRDVIEQNCRDRNVSVDLDRLIELKNRRGELIIRGDELRQERNTVSAAIPKASNDERPALIERGREIRGEIDVVESDQKTIEAELDDLLRAIPNLTHPDTPVGHSEDDSRVIRTVGTPPKFDFEPADHVDLMERLDLLDLEAGARVAGHGFYFLKNEAVFLELALVQYALDVLRRHGFTIYTTPDLARDEVLAGTGFSPRGNETQIYSLSDSDLSLIATAEITLGGSLRDQILDRSDLPIAMAGVSHCFRTEAGAHGRATRGIYRVHQFTKVEIFGFCEPTLDASGKFHDRILAIEEEIFRGLDIPYQVVDIATGDLGGSAYRKFDLEAWMPGRGDGGSYGEVTSTSNCTDYQSRRLGIRCKSSEKKGTEFVHTLNGTAVATTRAMIAILENHQTADGTVTVPEVLRPWTGFDTIGSPKEIE